jgi:hypothetical protein
MSWQGFVTEEIGDRVQTLATVDRLGGQGVAQLGGIGHDPGRRRPDRPVDDPSGSTTLITTVS